MDTTGDGDVFLTNMPPERKQRRRNSFDIAVAVALPWLVFLLILCLFLFIYQDVPWLVWTLIALNILISLVFMVLGAFGQKGMFFAIGVLIFSSILIATGIGIWLDDAYLRQYNDLSSREELKDVNPSVVPTSKERAAGIVTFQNTTFVDDRRTLGYVSEGKIFCAAPVALAGKLIADPSYWAVGEQCCEKRSNFDCGTARDPNATQSVVVASSDPSIKKYQAAVRQALSIYGTNISAADDAMIVEFVSNAKGSVSDLWDSALNVAAIALTAEFMLCVLAGIILSRSCFRRDRGGFAQAQPAV